MSDWMDNVEKVITNKVQMSIRLDPDVRDWYRDNYDKYQTMMNKVLRAYMQEQIIRKNNEII